MTGRVLADHIPGWPVGYCSRYEALWEVFLYIVTVKEESAIVLIRMRWGDWRGRGVELKLRKKRSTDLLDKTFCERVFPCLVVVDLVWSCHGVMWD